MSLSKYLHWRWGTDACRKSSALPYPLPHHMSSFRCWERCWGKQRLETVWDLFSWILLHVASLPFFLESRIVGIGSLDTGGQMLSVLGRSNKLPLIPKLLIEILTCLSGFLSQPKKCVGMWCLWEEIALLQSLQDSSVQCPLWAKGLNGGSFGSQRTY